MLLRIIDQSKPNDSADSVEVQLVSDSFQKTFRTDYFPSPLTTNLKQLLQWYFTEYLQATADQASDRGTVTKLLSLGQRMADNLLGEDHELISICEVIESQGSTELQVELVSSRIAFFEEQWEALVLPEAKYVLSAATRSFTRRFEVADNNLRLLGSEDAPTTVNITYLFDASTQLDALEAVSGLFVDGIRYNGAIKICLSSIEQLPEQNHICVLPHTIQLSEQGATLLERHLAAESSQVIELSDLVARLNATSCQLLICNGNFVDANGQAIDPETGLAWFAQLALTQGVANVVGFGQSLDALSRQQSIIGLVQAIAQGCSVGQAVVETRKSIQRTPENTTFSAAPVTFQYWSCLRHYCAQDVILRAKPLTIEPIEQSHQYAELRRMSHGIKADYWYPSSSYSVDQQFTRSLHQLISEQIFVLAGGEAGKGEGGVGKTHQLHQLGFHWLLSQYQHTQNPLSQLYYFDFAEHPYTRQDMAEMIAPTVEIAPALVKAQPEEVWQKIAKNQHCFLLDNLECAEDASGLVQQLRAIGQVVLAATATSGTLKQYPVHHILPLDLKASRILAAQRLAALNKPIPVDHSYLRLIAGLQGNPFLIKHVCAQLAIPESESKSAPESIGKSSQALLKQVEQHIDIQQKSTLVSQFQQWQWASLGEYWQAWLLLLIETPNLLLEVVALTSEDATNAEFQALMARLSQGKPINEKDKSFNHGLRVMQQAGFIQQLPYGRVLSKSHLPFLQQQRHSHNPEVFEATTVALAKVVSQAFQRLIPHLQRKPDQHIVQHLLVHRDIWAKQMETLWLAEQSAHFMTMLHLLKQFLAAYQLADEVPVWASRLILKQLTAKSESAQSAHFEVLSQATFDAFSNVEAIDQQNMPALIALMTLCASAVTPTQQADGIGEEEKAQLKSILVTIADRATTLLHHSGLPTDLAPIIQHHVLHFLTPWHRYNQDWQSLQTCALMAETLYVNTQAWPRALDSMLLTLDVSTVLDDTPRIEIYEDKLLNSVPYDKLPPGTYIQTAVKVVASRVQRNASTLAQALLDELSASQDAKPMEAMLMSLQADIWMLEARFEPAIEVYAQQWQSLAENSAVQTSSELSLVTVDGPVADYLREQFSRVQDEVGIEQLSAWLANQLSVDCPRPI